MMVSIASVFNLSLFPFSFHFLFSGGVMGGRGEGSDGMGLNILKE